MVAKNWAQGFRGFGKNLAAEDEERQEPAPAPTPAPAGEPAPTPTTTRPTWASGFEGFGPTPEPTPTAPDPVQVENDRVQRGAQIFQEWVETADPETGERQNVETTLGTDPTELKENNQQVVSLASFLSRMWFVAQDTHDEEMQDTTREILGVFGNAIGPDLLEQYGLDEVPMAPSQEAAIEERARSGGLVEVLKTGIGRALGDNPVGRAVANTLEVIGRPGEGIATAIALGHSGEGGGAPALAALGRGLTFQDQPGDLFGKAEDIDLDGDGFINFREVVGVDPDFGGDSWLGLVVGTLDTIGLALLDPGTFASFGTAHGIKGGVQAASRVGGPRLAREVAEHGTRNLSDDILRAIREEIEQSVEDAARRGAAMTRAERLSAIEDITVRQAEVARQMAQIEKGTPFVSMAGVPVRTPIDPVVRNLPGRRQFGDLAAAGNVLDTPTSAVRRDIAGVFGEGVDNVTQTARGLKVEGGVVLRGTRDEVGRVRATLNDDGTALLDEIGITAKESGLGTQYLNEMVEGLQERGFHTIRLTAEGDGAGFFPRRGFTPDADSGEIGALNRSNVAALRQLADDVELDPGLVSDVVEPTGRVGAGRRTPRKTPTETGTLGIPDSEFTPSVRRITPDELRGLADELEAVGEFGRWELLDDIVGGDVWSRAAREADLRLPMVRRLDDATPLRPGALQGFLDEPRLQQRFAAPETSGGALGAAPGPARRALDPIRPRADVRRELGENIARIVDDVRVETQALSEAKFMQMTDELDGALRRAGSELDSDFNALTTSARQQINERVDSWVRPVLEGDDYLLETFGHTRDSIGPYEFAEQVATSWARSGNEEMANYLRTVMRWRREIDQASEVAGLAVDKQRQWYMPRTLTREGREAVIEKSAIESAGLDPSLRLQPDDATSSLGEFGFQSERTFLPDTPVEDVNKVLARQLKMPEGTEFFNTSVLGALATRGRSAFRAATQADLLRGLGNEILEGTPLVMFDDGSRAVNNAAVKAGYARLRLPGGDVFAPEAIVKELRQTMEAIHSDAFIRGFEEFTKNWSQIWGAWATSPLIDGLGFHSRNATGNLMLNALAGVVNPRQYARAANLQQKFYRAGRLVRRGDATWDDVWEQVGISAADRRVLEGVLDHDILGTGFFDDIVHGTTDRAKLYEILGSNRIIESGRMLGNAVEDNARLTHYLSKLDSGQAPREAARSVRQFLFDYSDLTEFERKIRFVSRFYTFMRKNTGVQLWGLTRRPGLVAQLEESVGSPLGGQIGQTLGLEQPAYSRERGDRLDSPLSGVLGGITQGVAAGVDTPFSAAIETLTPLYEALNNAPGIRDLLPGESDAGSFWRSTLNLTSGGARSLTDLVYAEVTGQSLLTGAPLEEPRYGAEQRLYALIDTAVGPIMSQLDRAVGRATAGEGIGPLGNNMSAGAQESARAALVLSNLLGLNVAPLSNTEDGAAPPSTLYALNEWLQAELDEMGAPTLTELREAGEVPEPVREDRPPRSVSLRETLGSLEDKGLDTTEVELDLAEALAAEAEAGVDYETGKSRRDRGYDFAEAQGWLRRDRDTGEEEPVLDFRTKAHYNEANPDDQFLREDGTPYTLAEWQEWVDESGVIYADDGTYTTRTARGRDLAAEVGVVDEEGEPLMNNLVRAFYNQQNPDDLFLREDGTPVTYRNVDVVWPGSSFSEMRDWLVERGAPINPRASSVRAEYRDLYNEANPDRPYFQPLDWLRAGQRPLQGVKVVREDGQEFEVWPEGMSESNWWLVDPDTGARIN